MLVQRVSASIRRHPHAHRNHLLAAVDARQVAFGAHVVKEDDVACAEGAFRAVAVGDGERAGQHSNDFNRLAQRSTQERTPLAESVNVIANQLHGRVVGAPNLDPMESGLCFTRTSNRCDEF